MIKSNKVNNILFPSKVNALCSPKYTTQLELSIQFVVQQDWHETRAEDICRGCSVRFLIDPFKRYGFYVQWKPIEQGRDGGGDEQDQRDRLRVPCRCLQVLIIEISSLFHLCFAFFCPVIMPSSYDDFVSEVLIYRKLESLRLGLSCFLLLFDAETPLDRCGLVS